MADSEDEDHRSTLLLNIQRNPSQSFEDMLLERLHKLENACYDHEERLKFLDPELKATHSRIDMVESVCDANTNQLQKLQSSKQKVFVENSVTYNSSNSSYSSSYNNVTTAVTSCSSSLPATPPTTPMYQQIDRPRSEC
jgi:hypothetical protein